MLQLSLDSPPPGGGEQRFAVSNRDAEIRIILAVVAARLHLGGSMD